MCPERTVPERMVPERMVMVLARHGNTFAPGQKAVWVGRETDLPLVEKGVAQAHALAAALRARGFLPTRVFCGALQRTRRFAEIVAEDLALGFAPTVEPRLNEIDYGLWAGKTAEEIAGDLGQEELLRRWNEEDAWPAGAGWGSSEAEVLGGLSDFLDEIRAGCGAGGRLLVVSSSGVLRFVPRLSGLAHPDGAVRSFRMKTGHVGVLECRDGAFALRCWNVAPDDMVL